MYLDVFDNDRRVEFQHSDMLCPHSNLQLDQVGSDFGAVDGMAELFGQAAVMVVVKVRQKVTSGALYRPVGKSVHDKTGVGDLFVKGALSVGVVVKAAGATRVSRG